MAVTVKQISVLQSNGSYLTKDIGVDAQNVDIDETHTLANKVIDWDNKVDKDGNKVLSTNDYTTEEKNKLAGLSNYNDSALSERVTNIENVIPSTVSVENKLATMADIPAGGGTGAEGTTDYSELSNNPQIAGITLSGNKTLSDLGIQPAEENKGLSTNDYTTEDKEKLAGLSNYDDSGLSSRVTNLEDVIPETATSSNKLATLADIPSGTGTGGGTTNYPNLTNKPKIAGVELVGDKSLADLGIQPAETGKGLSSNDFTNTEKTKLEGIETGAKENVIESISVNGTTQEIVDKNVEITIPQISTSVPNGGTTGQALVKKSDTDGDVEWKNISGGDSSFTFNNSDFKVSAQGEVSLDPSQRIVSITKEEYEALSEEEQKNGTNYFITNGTDDELNNKVDKIEGKGLSTNDYTTEEKNKLAGLSNYDDTALDNRIDNIEELIPTTASENNKLATMADISSGSGDTVDYNNLLTLINYDPDQSPYNVEVGETYILGSGAKTNQNNSIQVKCLSIDNETAIMQTYGVTAGSWPGSEDLTENYSNYWGDLSNAISEVKLPTGTNTNNIEPLGAYDVLKTAASNYSSFGAGNSYAWLGTPNGSDHAYNVNLSGSVDNDHSTSNSCVCAPYFALNLAKVLINDGVIELNPSYRDAEFTDVISKIEQKLNNRYTKSEVDSLLENNSSIPEGGTTGQVLAKKSDTDGDVEWINASNTSNGSSNTFNTSDFDITEQGEVSLKPSQRAWIGTRAEWDALPAEEKEKYGGIINITDDPNELDNKVDKIEGKGLSTNDFTDAEKTKLSEIESGAEVNIIESISVNGVPQTIADKNIDITVSGGGSSYSIITPSDIDRLWGSSLENGDSIVYDDIVDGDSEEY